MGGKTPKNSRCLPVPRKLILEEAARAEAQCIQRLADAIFVQATSFLKPRAGGEIPAPPSPSQSTARPPGLRRGAPPPPCPLSAEVPPASPGAMTWALRSPPRRPSDFPLRPATWAGVGPWPLPRGRDLPVAPGGARARGRGRPCPVPERTDDRDPRPREET